MLLSTVIQVYDLPVNKGGGRNACAHKDLKAGAGTDLKNGDHYSVKEEVAKLCVLWYVWFAFHYLIA